MCTGEDAAITTGNQKFPGAVQWHQSTPLLNLLPAKSFAVLQFFPYRINNYNVAQAKPITDNTNLLNVTSEDAFIIY